VNGACPKLPRRRPSVTGAAAMDRHERGAHAAILVALRLNSDRSEHQRRGDGVEGGRRDGNADHAVRSVRITSL
jgi:hypothetical protein